MTSVHVVMVTYGQRLELIQRALDSLLEEPLVKAIHVVSNAASFEIPQHQKIKPLLLRENSGSANGYKVGIVQALSDAPDFVWLLDDDNVGVDDALPRLLKHYEQLAVTHSLLAVAARRPGRAITPVTKLGEPSFLGFRSKSLPGKLLAQFRRRQKSIPTAPTLAAYCPFGGLLFPANLIEVIGLPREDFVLYADDLEFTSRIPQAGGQLYVIPEVQVDDLAESWNISEEKASSLNRWLSAPGDSRAYYSARNLAYLEQTRSSNSWRFRCNRAIYTVFLAVYATVFGKSDRFKILLQAFADAADGRLGRNEQYPLW